MTKRHHEGKSYQGNGIKGGIIPTVQTQKEHTRSQLNGYITDNNTATFSVNNWMDNRDRNSVPRNTVTGKCSRWQNNM